MPKATAQLDVLVLGQHPCAYLAADILCTPPAKSEKPLHVAHATIPGDHPPDRLVILNPQVFALHKPLEKARKKLQCTSVWGVRFLADDGQTCGTRPRFASQDVVLTIGAPNDATYCNKPANATPPECLPPPAEEEK